MTETYRTHVRFRGIISGTARCVNTKRSLTHLLDLGERGIAVQATRPKRKSRPRPIGVCPACGHRLFLRADGMMQGHPAQGRNTVAPCPGVGAAPAVQPVPAVCEGERWLPVVSYEGLYEVSDLGRVRSLRMVKNGGVLRQRSNTHEYPVVDLCVNWAKETLQVHQMVAAAFIGPCPEGEEVRHKDGQRAHCEASNLEYGTSSENKADSVEHGTHANNAKTHCPQGHEYAPENTYRYPSRPNNRICKTCERGRKAKKAA